MSIEVHGVAPLISVFDMPASLRFYRDSLGFQVTGSSPALSGNPDHVHWCMLQLGAATIMLNDVYENQPPARDLARWSGHQDTCLYFGCPDVDAAYAHLRSQGLQLNPPNIAPYGMKQLYLTDPDGYLLCFQWKA
jgi:uncharacterized glyoxalase superfamily protein PhnB